MNKALRKERLVVLRPRAVVVPVKAFLPPVAIPSECPAGPQPSATVSAAAPGAGTTTARVNELGLKAWNFLRIK